MANQSLAPQPLAPLLVRRLAPAAQYALRRLRPSCARMPGRRIDVTRCEGQGRTTRCRGWTT